MTRPAARAVLTVRPDTIRLTSAFHRSMPKVESCCFWFGPRAPNGDGTVEAIVVPRQRNEPGHYYVEADAMLRVAEEARRRGWKNLAQVHSHPGPAVRHSGYDDEMANSRRALSLVYPNYGAVPSMWRFRSWLWRLWPGAFPPAIGVHAFRNGAWAYLSQSDVATSLRLEVGLKPLFIDLRS
jgi:proteasome lid subunit RPN8/RPN11